MIGKFILFFLLKALSIIMVPLLGPYFIFWFFFEGSISVILIILIMKEGL